MLQTRFVVSLLTSVVLAMVGCTPVGPGETGPNSMRFALSVNTSPMAVIADEPARRTYTLGVPSVFGQTPAFEDITIDLADTLASIEVEVTDETAAKLLQGGAPVPAQMWVRMAAAGAVDTVCESGELYGPFTIQGDSAFQPMSVDPPTASASAQSLQVINSGAFVLCVEVLSPVDASLSVRGLAVDATLMGAGDCADEPANFSGNWMSTYTCENTCSGTENGEFATEIIQNGTTAQYTDGSVTFSGTVCGNVFSFEAGPGLGFSEEGTLTLNADGTLSRESEWRDDPPSSCGGTCTDTFVRLDSGSAKHKMLPDSRQRFR